MSETRAVTLETSVDTTGARAGFQEIQREAGTMAQAVARASEHADTAVEGIGTSAASSARNVDASTRNMINAIQRQTAAMEAGSRSGSAYYEVLARQRGVDPAALEPYLAQLRAIEQQQARTNNAVGGAARPLHQVEMSAAQTAAALRMVPAQFTDIVTGLQGGQSPMTILFQQGGQLRDMFGSTGGAARALGGYVLGLVTPFTVATAAAIGLAFAYKNGRDEINAFNMAIITSGNAAGTTADQLADMAARVSQVSGSRGAAVAALNGLVQTGQVQAQSLQVFALAVVDAERIMGRSVEQTTSDFEKLGKAPLQGLDEINAKYHNVTAATYAQVKALQDQGRYAEAANVAQQAYADGIIKQKQAVLDSMTEWERGWIRIKNGISGAIDSLLHLRESTSSEKIRALFKENEESVARIEQLKKRGRDRDGDKYDPSKDPDVLAAEAAIAANEREVKSIWDKQGEKKKAAAADAKTQRAEDVRKGITKDADIFLTREELLKRQIVALDKESADLGLSSGEAKMRRDILIRQNYDLVTEAIERQIEAIRRKNALGDLKAEPEAGQIVVDRTTGLISESQALEKYAALDIDALARRRKAIVDQIAVVNQLVDSAQKRSRLDDLNGQLEENRVLLENRRTKLRQDQLLADVQANRASASLYGQLYDQQDAKALDLRSQAQDQRDYNEQIGKSSEELLELIIAKREDAAISLERRAIIAEGYDLDGSLADAYRKQAAQLRERSAAEREGFVKARDPYVNIRMSLNRYVEESENAGGMVGDALTSAFRRAEDAFADFVTNGKLSFSSLATSIIADFARIQAKAAIGGFVKSILGSMGTDTTSGWGASLMQALGVSGARAAGGPVNSGLSYLVGEKGPEIFTPSTSGSITPNHMIGSGGGSPMNISFNTTIANSGSNTQVAGDGGANSRAALDALHASFKQWLAGEARQGGQLWKLQQGRG